MTSEHNYLVQSNNLKLSPTTFSDLTRSSLNASEIFLFPFPFEFSISSILLTSLERDYWLCYQLGLIE